jgi:rhodanese-related sulfurtransferase
LVANETNALVLDTRDPEKFSKGFIPNSINIGIDGSFAMWVGGLITDIKQEILIVAEPGKEEEAIIRLSRVGYDHAIGFLKGGFDAWLEAGKEFDFVERIDATQFAEAFELHPDIIDMRKKSEFDSEHIVGATNIPLNELANRISELPKERPFTIHCAGGYRSMIAASMLKARGYDNFVDVRGGMTDINKTAIPKTEYVCPTTLL